VIKPRRRNGRACGTCAEEERCIQLFFWEGGGPEGKRPLERPRRRWGRISKLILRKWKAVGWFGQDQDRENW